MGSDGAGDDVEVVFFSPSWFRDARSARASCKGDGNSRPLFSARRKIPAAALGLKKNLSGTVARSTSAKDEDPSPPLGHSEVSAVQHSPGEVVKPELGQRRENDGEIPSAVGGKKSGNVFKQEPSPWSDQSVGDSCELEEEAGAVSCEPASLAGD